MTTTQQTETYPNNQRAATRQTRRTPALRPVLKRMMDDADNPHATEDRETIKAQFLQFMHSEAGAVYRETAYAYWLDNNYRSLLADYPEPGEDVVARVEQRAALVADTEKKKTALKASVEKAIEIKAQILLLDWTLPNGKTLRTCTGRECRQMSGKVGKWLGQIADRVKPIQLVGDVMKEADVRKLFDARK